MVFWFPLLGAAGLLALVVAVVIIVVSSQSSTEEPKEEKEPLVKNTSPSSTEEPKEDEKEPLVKNTSPSPVKTKNKMERSYATIDNISLQNIPEQLQNIDTNNFILGFVNYSEEELKSIIRKAFRKLAGDDVLMEDMFVGFAYMWTSTIHKSMKIANVFGIQKVSEEFAKGRQFFEENKIHIELPTITRVQNGLFEIQLGDQTLMIKEELEVGPQCHQYVQRIQREVL